MYKLTDDNPELPEHDQRATDSVGRHFSRVDRNCRILGANANTHDKARPEKPLPAFRKCRANRSRSQAGRGEENLASSPEIVV